MHRHWPIKWSALLRKFFLRSIRFFARRVVYPDNMKNNGIWKKWNYAWVRQTPRYDQQSQNDSDPLRNIDPVNTLCLSKAYSVSPPSRKLFLFYKIHRSWNLTPSTLSDASVSAFSTRCLYVGIISGKMPILIHGQEIIAVSFFQYVIQRIRNPLVIMKRNILYMKLLLSPQSPPWIRRFRIILSMTYSTSSALR